MVELTANELDLIFHALADQTRRAILNNLAVAKQSVSEIARPFHMSLAAVSKHLKVLERAGLIEREKQGVTYMIGLNQERLLSAEQWLSHYRLFWGDRLDALQQFLEEEEQK